MELAEKGIRVNSINPGFLDTAMHEVIFDIGRDSETYAEIVAANVAKHPLHRIGYAEDCVNGIAFLADEGANFITGLLLAIDG